MCCDAWSCRRSESKLRLSCLYDGPRRVFQLVTFILVAVWVLKYLGGVALHPKEVHLLPVAVPID